jgi:hypothetical protein
LLVRWGVTGVKVLRGSCLCGAVEYAVADEFVYALICHPMCT